MAAEAFQYRLLQESPGRQRHQGRAAHHQRRGEGEALQERAGDDLERCTLGAARHRKTSFRAQQEAHGRLCHPGRVVQLYRSRFEVTRKSMSGPSPAGLRLETAARASRRGAPRAKREGIDGELRVAAAADALMRWNCDGPTEAAARDSGFPYPRE